MDNFIKIIRSNVVETPKEKEDTAIEKEINETQTH